ncbi:hypothetical protein PIB30_042565, partial [Stylosanthes scabra]|nr:hypothetical protein [Stylosanthes scabra]
RYRNQHLFAPFEIWTPFTVASFAKRWISDLDSMHSRPAFVRENLLCVIWEKPLVWLHKVNCDACVFTDHQRADFGCVLRDDMGSWVKGCSESLLLWSIRRCELFALWRGLVLAWECGSKFVICESDSRDAILDAQSAGI